MKVFLDLQSVHGRDDLSVIPSIFVPPGSKLFHATAIRPLWAKLPCAWFFQRRPIVGKKLYVGNLSYDVTDSDLQNLFQAHGTVQSAQVIMDRDAGRSKGFGFVEMGNDQEAQAAIAGLNGHDNNGRALTVNEA